MAIATGIPGLEVTIEVDAVALPEYQHGIIEDDEVATSASRYVEAPPATDFAIRYLFRPPFTPPSAIQMDVLLDGDYVQAPFVEWGGKENCEGYLCSRSTSSTGGHSFTQGFRFAELRTGKLSCLAKCWKSLTTHRRDQHPHEQGPRGSSITDWAHCALLLLHRASGGSETGGSASA